MMGGHYPDGITPVDIDRASDGSWSPSYSEYCRICGAAPDQACEPDCGLLPGDVAPPDLQE